MKAFHVYLNGKKVTTAGVGDFGVLTGLVTWVRREARDTQSKKRNRTEEELTLSVGGLISSKNEHVQWVDQDLSVGDEVRIQVVDSDSIDRPRTRRRRQDPAQELRAQKRYVKEMAKHFGWTIKTRL